MSAVRKPTKQIDPFRRSLYAKIEIAKKELGLDDDAYRDIIAQKFAGKSSRTQLGNRQLDELIQHFKSLGFKPRRRAPKRAGRAQLSSSDTARKIRALWVSLYHLGMLSDPSESAMGAFIKRQAKVDDARFLAPEEAYKVIEALKSWATREAKVNWASYPVGLRDKIERPRCRVLEAQWKILHGNLDKLQLSLWAEKFVQSPCQISYVHLDDDQADRAIEAMGAKVRALKGAAQ
ncbi:regulatory protein GemA [Thalassospira alkalitolerans]|uniref:gp16 family protein n=1 Tax=Thalassospira alkalitolerans TaxID=1293890 RepID=UPI0030ED9EC9|tara:strand:+ start:110 stop:811 length:702 start_codon:yes stop_codon:yes gene_type:complete